MFTDYNDENCGYKGSSERSSIKKFYNFLKEQYGDVTLTDLSIQGFQPDELWALFTGEYDNLTNGAKMHFGWWTDGKIFNSKEAMAETYVDAIKNADVLTYDIGENYFGTYIGDRAGVAGVNEGGEHFTELLDCLSDEEQAQVEELRKELMSKLETENKALAETVDGMLYAYVSYIYYTDKCIDKIYEINPDIDLIVCGLYNPHPELSITLENGKKLNYSALIDVMMESLNFYASVLNKHADDYKFADMSKNTPISFADELYYYPEDLSLDAKYMLAAMICDPSTNIYDSGDCVFWDALIDEGVTVDEFLINNDRVSLSEIAEMWGRPVDFVKYMLYSDPLGLGILWDENDTISAAEFWKMNGANTWDRGKYTVPATESSKDEYPFPAPEIVNELWKKAMDRNGYVKGNKESAIKATEKSIEEFTALFNNNERACDWDINHMDKNSDIFKTEVVPLVEPYFDICVKAMQHRNFTLEQFVKLRASDLTEEEAKATIDRLVNHPEIATEFDYLMLHWQIRHGSAARGFGAHPCPRGQQAKYENIIAAYTSQFSSREQSITKQISNAREFVKSGKMEETLNQLVDITKQIAEMPEVSAAIRQGYVNLLDEFSTYMLKNGWASEKELESLRPKVDAVALALASGDKDRISNSTCEFYKEVINIAGDRISAKIKKKLKEITDDYVVPAVKTGVTVAGLTVATITVIKTVDKLVKKAKQAEAERIAAEEAKQAEAERIAAEEAKQAEAEAAAKKAAEEAARLLEEAKTTAQQALREAAGDSSYSLVKKYLDRGCETVSAAKTPDKVMDETVKYAKLIGNVILVKDTKLIQNDLTAYKNGKIKVSFKNPGLEGTVNYQVARSTKSDFSKNKKTYTVKSKDQKTLTLTNTKNLKKGTKYYYKVRAKVQLSDGTYVYTKWSKVKNIKCKKTRK